MSKYISITILIDDIRDIHADLVLRNGIIARQIIPIFPWKEYEKITLYMDHDLGFGLNGYEILNMMINQYKIYPNLIILVTDNPVGRKNMENLLLNDVNIYNTVDGINFFQDR